MAEPVYDTVIVGGGIAGLTAAAYLTKNGQKVLLIEKNKQCGGLVNSFIHNGFQFDSGVRALLNAGIIFPMLEELDIELEVIKSKVSVGVENHIVHVEDRSSLDDYQGMLIHTYPDSEDEIRQFVRIVRKIMKDMDVLYGVENPMVKNIWNDKEFILKTLLPWLPRFLFTIGRINRLNTPVERYLENLLENPSLRDIISQHFFKSTPAFFALSYFSLYLDYFYPKGGVGKLAEAFERKLRELGGEIKSETRIVEVRAGERIVADEENSCYRYRKLIWAADLKTFYKITETRGFSDKIRKRFEKKKATMMKHRGGDSVYTLFLEVDEPLDSFRRIGHGHFFYSPSKTGLGETHRTELSHMIDHWGKISKEQVFEWIEKFTRLSTYEISIPGLKDPDLCPPGKAGVVISFLTEYDLFQKVREEGWYEEFLMEMGNRIVEVLTHSVYPMLKNKILDRFAFTPLSIENRIGSSEGAITGWSFQDPVPVIHKMQKSGRSVITPLPSVFQAGQWAYSPAGVPMSILTGKLAADKALR